MPRHHAAVLATVALLCWGQSADAQRMPATTLEVRAGASVGSWDGAGGGMDFSPGAAIGVSGAIQVASRIALEGGYSRSAFGCTKGFCKGRQVTLTSAGPEVGVRVSPWGGTWLNAVVTLHELDMPASGTGNVQSERAPGIGIGGGFERVLRGPFVITPGIRYATWSAKMPGEDAGDRVHYFTLGVGVRFRSTGR